MPPTRERVRPDTPVPVLLTQAQESLLPREISIVQGVQSRLTTEETLLEFKDGTAIQVPIKPAFVEELAEAMRNGLVAPPIDIVRTADGTNILARGFTRYAAHVTAMGISKPIAVTIHPGTVKDAKQMSIGSNVEHGNRRTRQDSWHEILMILLDRDLFYAEPGVPLSWREIAKMAKVTHPTVMSMADRVAQTIRYIRLGEDPKEYEQKWFAHMVEQRIDQIPTELHPTQAELQPDPQVDVDVELEIAEAEEAVQSRPQEPDYVDTRVPEAIEPPASSDPAETESYEERNKTALCHPPKQFSRNWEGTHFTSEITAVCFTCRGGDFVKCSVLGGKNQAFDSLKARGWIHEDSYWFCPNCKEK